MPTFSMFLLLFFYSFLCFYSWLSIFKTLSLTSLIFFSSSSTQSCLPLVESLLFIYSVSEFQLLFSISYTLLVFSTLIASSLPSLMLFYFYITHIFLVLPYSSHFRWRSCGFPLVIFDRVLLGALLVFFLLWNKSWLLSCDCTLAFSIYSWYTAWITFLSVVNSF